MICLHCKQPVVWNEIWNAWEHKDLTRFASQLCEPDKGYEQSNYATPSFGE